MTKYKYALAFMHMINGQDIEPGLIVNPNDLRSNIRILIQRLKRIVFSESFLNVTKNPTDQAVMYTILRVAFFQDSLAVKVSCREVASIVNCVPTSASNSLKRLVNYGMIEVVKNGYHHYAPYEFLLKLAKSSKSYRITMQEMFMGASANFVQLDNVNCTNLALTEPDMSEPGTDFYLITRNAFVNGHSWVKDGGSNALHEGEKIPRLNKTAGRVFITLLNFQMLTSQELVAHVGFQKRAVQYALSRLLGYELVTQVKIEHGGKRYNKWVANQNAEFSVVEEALGLEAWREVKYVKYVKESNDHADRLEDPDKQAEYKKQQEELKKSRRKKAELKNEAYKKAEQERQRKKAQRRYHRLKDL